MRLTLHLFENGASISRVVKKLGISKKKARKRRKILIDLNLLEDRPIEYSINKEKILHLLVKRIPATGIAKQLGLSESYVHKCRIEFKTDGTLEMTGDPTNKEKILHLLVKLDSAANIAKKLGLSERYVRRCKAAFKKNGTLTIDMIIKSMKKIGYKDHEIEEILKSKCVY